MNDEDLRKFHGALSQHRDDLLSILNSNSINNSVHFHNTTVREMLKVVSEFKDALERIERGDFGTCTNCGGGIELERLKQDFTTCLCLDCYTEDEKRILERDLELTAKIQKELLPCSTPEIKNIQFAHLSKPAGIVSGDYHDFFKLADGTDGFIIADVMGKGLPASILMANLQATLRILSPEYTDLAKLTSRINGLFRYNINMIRFISLCLVGVDAEKSHLNYCNAGHHPPVFWDYDQQKIRWLNPTGPAIGLMKEAKYTSRSFEISANDLLFLYTDGLIEARNQEGEEFGDKRLYQFIESNNHKSADVFLKDMLDTARTFASKFNDDLTMLVVKVLE